MEEVAQVGCGGRWEWSDSAEEDHSAEVRERERVAEVSGMAMPCDRVVVLQDCVLVIA